MTVVTAATPAQLRLIVLLTRRHPTLVEAWANELGLHDDPALLTKAQASNLIQRVQTGCMP